MLQLVREHLLGVVQQPPDQRALAVVHRARRGKPQQLGGSLGEPLEDIDDPLLGDPLLGAGDPVLGDPLLGDPLACNPLLGDPLAGRVRILGRI